MSLLSYLQFIAESKSEVELPTIFLKDFYHKIQKIKSPITDEFNRIYDFGDAMWKRPSKWTFIGESNQSDKVVFSESWRIKDWIIATYGYAADCEKMMQQMTHPNSQDEIISNSPRVEMKVGRFIRGYFKDQFSDSEIENFVNQWKSLEENIEFEIWTGSDIKNGYLSRKYHFNDYDRGINPLMNSCMNDTSYISFYQYCPSVKLLVLLDQKKQILGRALIWEDYMGRKIMDRIYYVYDKDYFHFVRWAKEHDYYYKEKNTGLISFIKNDGVERLKTRVKIMNAFLFPEEEYPFMDTFCYIQDEWAYNYEPEGLYWRFQNTDGTYDEDFYQ